MRTIKDSDFRLPGKTSFQTPQIVEAEVRSQAAQEQLRTITGRISKREAELARQRIKNETQ
jgi:hypothetical protein